jgi:hypothetical protein
MHGCGGIDPGPSPMVGVGAGLAETPFGEEIQRPDTGADHFSHAPDQICVRCDRRIEAREPARRRGEDRWAHDVCPPPLS